MQNHEILYIIKLKEVTFKNYIPYFIDSGKLCSVWCDVIKLIIENEN